MLPEGTELRASERRVRRPAARLVFTLLLALPWLTAPKEAQAYLDPGTGSILLQIILGGVAGLGVVGKLYWHRVMRFIGIRQKGSQEEPPPAVK